MQLFNDKAYTLLTSLLDLSPYNKRTVFHSQCVFDSAILQRVVSLLHLINVNGIDHIYLRPQNLTEKTLCPHFLNKKKWTWRSQAYRRKMECVMTVKNVQKQKNVRNDNKSIVRNTLRTRIIARGIADSDKVNTGRKLNNVTGALLLHAAIDLILLSVSF